MADVNSLLSQRLRELRGTTPLNQVQSATGLERRLLKFYEEGDKVPGDQNLKKLSVYYDVPFASLKELQLADMYPESSENREILINWVRKLI